eukprot:1159928-Pelagomonas_calceolata.AAC.13
MHAAGPGLRSLFFSFSSWQQYLEETEYCKKCESKAEMERSSEGDALSTIGCTGVNSTDHTSIVAACETFGND